MIALGIGIAVSFHLTATLLADHFVFIKHHFASVLAFAAATVATVYASGSAL